MEIPFARNESVIEVTTKDYTNGFLKEILQKYGWNAEMAYAIMLCESGGNPKAHNFSDTTRDDSWGLFQINLYGALAKERPIAEWLLTPENNIEYAYKLYQTQGWYAWERCYNLLS